MTSPMGSSAALIRAMIQIREEMEHDDQRAGALGLSSEELAFYDAVAKKREEVYGVPVLRDLIHEVVEVIKKNLRVDWTEPHREDVKAAVRAAVKRVLQRRSVRAEDFEPFVQAFMEQAEALYSDWPTAA